MLVSCSKFSTAINISFTITTPFFLPGEPHTFSVTVTPLRDQPLDLYILIDLSASMGEHLAALKQSAGNIGMKQQRESRVVYHVSNMFTINLNLMHVCL